jgi:putative ABC transport system permease protein
VYYPYPQLSTKFRFGYGDEHLYATFLVRTAGDPATLGPVMKRAALDVAKDITVSEAQTIEDIRSQTALRSKFDTWLLVAFAATAVALAAVGAFGVTSYSTEQRTHEIGVRIALGADYCDVLWLVLKRGLLMTSIGLLIGLVSSLWLARFLVSEFSLNEVESSDLATLAAVCLLLALVALLACYIPARRAARMNPLTSLRHE